MKIAITASADDLEAAMDERFGRCPYFCVIDTDKDEAPTFLENQGVKQGHGAGIKAAQQIADEKIEALITGNVGPNALAVLEQFEIKVYQSGGSIAEAVELFKKGKLDQLQDAVRPHFGMR